jgi:two-component system KDP operon response regulator KdpE
MRIVLIDNDPDTHGFVTPYLARQGIDVLSAYSGPEGLKLVQTRDPDAVLLDIELPNMDGWEVCRRVRIFSDVPIMIVSAVARSDSDIIRGLSIGADDYMTKPLHLRMLDARLKALLRRSRSLTWRETRQAYVDQRLVVDLHREQVLVNGLAVSLTALEYGLLALLVRNAGQVIPTITIVEELWSEAVIDDYVRYVRVYVKRLRGIIEPNPSAPRYILNEHGVGYRFMPQT